MSNDVGKTKVIRILIVFLQVLIYIQIQIIFIPFAIIGMMIGLYKEMYLSKKLDVSFSAGQSLQYRWIMHMFETREDKNSVEFTKKFPCESHFALWTIMGPFIITQKLFNFRTSLGKLVKPGYEDIKSTSGIRVLKFDEVVEKYIDNMDQLVVLGSGFDLIALKYTKNKDIRVFEVDQTNTLNIKVETLKKAKIKHDWITFVPVDYNKESWADKLINSGFDKTKKTLFIWQSVSLYLEPVLVQETLKLLSELSTEGSVVAQDFYSLNFLNGTISKSATKMMSLIAKNGEPWKFSVDMKDNPRETISALLEENGLTMTDYYLFGEKLDVEPFYCIVEAKKSIYGGQ